VTSLGFRWSGAGWWVKAEGYRDQRAVLDPGANFIYTKIDQSNRLVDGTVMRQVQASEAKTHLPQLLDEVERGETIIITRHGRPIARIVPEADRRQQEIDEAIDDIKELSRQSQKLSVEEILSLIREGRKY